MNKTRTAVVLFLCGCAAFLFIATFARPLGSAPRSSARIEDAGQDPDLPPRLADGLSRREFMERRAEYTLMRRGIFRGQKVDLHQRQEAIKMMEEQETQL